MQSLLHEHLLKIFCRKMSAGYPLFDCDEKL